MNQDRKEEPVDFDVHNDSANLQGAAKVLNLLFFAFGIFGVLAAFGILAIIIVFTAFPVLIISKSKTAKGLAISALCGIVAAYLLMLIPGMTKY
ncbi:MAG: hypothetical protein ABIY70_22680 [Capsulimonas sp.]|uniref:hypothetical protein n=1 Tax=Capsulimonas sp. TaxID=2494211 RepID=UPI00326445D4